VLFCAGRSGIYTASDVALMDERLYAVLARRVQNMRSFKSPRPRKRPPPTKPTEPTEPEEPAEEPDDGTEITVVVFLCRPCRLLACIIVYCHVLSCIVVYCRVLSCSVV
jgi:hypothetical protein